MIKPLLLVVLFLRKSEQREFGEVDSPNPNFTQLSLTADGASNAYKTSYSVVGVALFNKANA
ncbi:MULTISPECIES: hypothetical protein [unclassified Nostoc]|uniref:hypothetical protein n=1 Tax=unclassified Nostoc TaxID=2593658 RepID=UPI002AD57CCC|nr:hypothetical protein [Nostoc sp. DedQUE03]MDZ7975260.1 hypothetical protein [Nostoc sp. DedQUE03]MDZ8048875.1 hypothetical protein [Nostoc sp. DedQUE02]